MVIKAVQHRGDLTLTSTKGINTGFGGSADVRTQNCSALDKSLLQTLQSTVLIEEDKSTDGFLQSGISSHALLMPWVKAMMAVRSNSCIRGHSAVSMDAVEGVLRLLEEGISPVIPLRGSISASGDLMPLSYVAGAIEGSPDVFVRVQEGKQCCIQTAEAALASRGIAPMALALVMLLHSSTELVLQQLSAVLYFMRRVSSLCSLHASPLSSRKVWPLELNGAILSSRTSDHIRDSTKLHTSLERSCADPTLYLATERR